jgi:hypothetical protein
VSDPFSVFPHLVVRGTVPGEWVAFQMVTEETGEAIQSFTHSICLCVPSSPSSVSPRRLSATPLGLQFPWTDAFQHAHPHPTPLGALFSQLDSCQAHELVVLCHHMTYSRWYLSTSAAMVP